MRVLIRPIFFSIFSILTPLSLAAGMPAIQALTMDGWRIYVDLESDPITIHMEEDGQGVNNNSKIFENEPCEFSEVVKNGRILRIFSCSSKAQSPFAGTKWFGRQPGGSCEDGNVDYEYECVSGCVKNKRAPFSVFQSHWEC